MYVCECGLRFDNKHKFAGHQCNCISHLGQERYLQMKNNRRKKYDDLQKLKLQKFISEKHTCKNCGKIMTAIFGSGIYCSRSCSNTRKHNIEYDKVCAYCGKPLVKWKQTKFCSSECQQKYRYDSCVKSWLDTGTFNTKNIPEPVRNYLLKSAEYKCSMCGWSELNIYSNTIPLEIDHIDGNSLNNSPTNLRVLCPNCHSLTPTYKNLNKGKGRKSLGIL